MSAESTVLKALVAGRQETSSAHSRSCFGIGNLSVWFSTASRCLTQARHLSAHGSGLGGLERLPDCRSVALLHPARYIEIVQVGECILGRPDLGPHIVCRASRTIRLPASQIHFLPARCQHASRVSTPAGTCQDGTAENPVGSFFSWYVPGPIR